MFRGMKNLAIMRATCGPPHVGRAPVGAPGAGSLQVELRQFGDGSRFFAGRATLEENRMPLFRGVLEAAFRRLASANPA